MDTNHDNKVARLSAYWTFFVSLLILVISLFSCSSVWFDLPEEIHNIRWFFAHTLWVPQLLTYLILPTSIVGVIFLWKTKQDSGGRNVIFISIFLLIGINLCALVLILPRIELLNVDHRQLGSISFKDHLYVVDSEFQSSPLSSSIHAYIVVWECDSLGLLCVDIYSDGIKIGGSDDFDNMIISFKPETKSLTVNVNNKEFYKFTP